mmetsp:Transcript_18371/g.27758  ORF Transcript_18371/g.27758 Transcript_18371/m.27758 type:complete len:624 (-) Transcript_18371:734-2605(-)
MMESPQLSHTSTNVESLKNDIPSESQLVLLSLDYLRDLRRGYASSQDLLEAEGLHADWLTLAIYALNQSFSRPESLTCQNDAWKEVDRPNSGLSPAVEISRLPSIEAMTREICYTENPHNDEDESGTAYDKDLESYAWYDYDDYNPANSHRFYSMNGLSSGPSGPLLLGEITAAGLAHLQARSRQDADQEMMASPLFEQFVETVRSKGFFDTEHDFPPDDPVDDEERISKQKQLYDERYQKAVAKFRSKLAANAEAEEPDTTLADYQHSRRIRRCLAARKERAEKKNQPTPDTNSVATNLSKKIDRLPAGPKSPSKNNPTDLEEAERLKSVGNVHMQKKEFDLAAELYTQALKLSPDGPASHIYFSNRAAALLSMKKFKEAITDSERALALKPDYAKAHARLGLAHFLSGEYRQAMEAYTVALKYEPGNKSSKSYLEKAARRLAADNDEMMNQTAEKAINSSFSVVSEWDKSSKVVSKEESARHYKEAEKYKLKGNSLMAKRDYSKAIEAYSAALKLSRDGPQSHVYFSNRSAALCYLERYHEASKDAEQSLRLVPTYGKAYARLGLARFCLNDFEGAVTAYQASLEFDPDNAASQSYLAKAKFKLEKQKELGMMEKEEKICA